MAKVKTVAGTLNVKGGKEMEADNLKGFKDGEKIVVFKRSEVVEFKYGKNKHLPEGTVVTMHVLDATVAQAMKKGSIVGEIPEKKSAE